MNHKIQSLIEYFHEIHFDSVFYHFLVLKKRKIFDVQFQKSFLLFLFLFRQIHPIGNFSEILKFLEKSQKKRKSKEKQKKFEENVFFKAFFPKNVLFEKHF